MNSETSAVASRTHSVDARWIMAYSAALGDFGPAHMDTTREQPVIAHPLFPVCLEWPVVLDVSRRDDAALENASGSGASVHASHDVHLHRPIRAGDTLTTTGVLAGIEQRKPGVFSTSCFETRDAEGERVVTTWQGGMAIGAKLDSEPVPAEAPLWPEPRSPISGEPLMTSDIHVPSGAAHVYTECARIWNPIHTDVAVARRSGLPDIILHGTATLALAVSRVAQLVVAGDTARVQRICGRFAAMVLMPSTLRLEILAQDIHENGEIVAFYVLRNPDGAPAISNGSVTFTPAAC